MSKLIDPRPRDVAIYVSTSYTDAEAAEGAAKTLRAHAVEVVSTWHMSPMVAWKSGASAIGGNGEEIASRCLTEMLRADWILVLAGGQPSTTGGTHAELGFAIGIKRPIILIGKPTSPFHYLRCIKLCGSIEEFLMGLMTARVKGSRIMSQHDRLRFGNKGQ